jgi:serine/threonine-protein kinase
VTRTGLILGERYRLDKRIAAGGVGQVWQAADLLLSRPVAVKVLRPEYADHPETLERFRKEARHAGALSHPHVAQVFDYGPAGPGWPPYLVMEFVDGPSLADILVVDPVEPAFALDVVAQAADGLSAAHRAGLVHRDVKPGNLLIGPDGLVKVTDFGIAYAAGQAPVTGPNLVMGTTQYMAPERIAGGPGTPASDLYALGIVLHECLTGIPPFEGAPADVMAAHLYLPLPPLPAGVPPELDALVARLTAKNPADRMTDARELSTLAAGLRDAVAAGRLVPSAQAAALSGPAAAVAGAGSAAAGADTAVAGRGDPSAGQARDDAQDGLAVTALQAADRPDAVSAPGVTTAGPAADGSATAAGGTAAFAGTALFGGSAPLTDEWSVPGHMSGPGSPAEPPGPGDPQRGRGRRNGLLAVAVAALAGAGLVVLLVSGVFRASPSANQAPVRPATTATTPGGRSTHGAAVSPSPGGTAGYTAPAVGATSPGASATRKASPSPSSSPSGSPSSSTGPSPSSSPSGSPSGSPTGSPTGSSSGSPSGSPTDSPSPDPSSSPTSACLLGVLCLG